MKRYVKSNFLIHYTNIFISNRKHFLTIKENSVSKITVSSFTSPCSHLAVENVFNTFVYDLKFIESEFYLIIFIFTFKVDFLTRAISHIIYKLK